MSHYQGSVPETPRKPDWRDNGLCREHNPELFFSDPSKQAAKAICQACPVTEACLQDALKKRIPYGVFGGLTHQERNSLRRSARRHHLDADATDAKAKEAQQPRPPRTLQSIFEASTAPLQGGHLAWTGRPQTHFQGQVYTPKQVSFAAARGHRSAGRLRAGCGIDDCVLPEHLVEVPAVAACGSRSGYQKHLREKTTVCGPCRRAHTDADARLRRTGTTKAAA